MTRESNDQTRSLASHQDSNDSNGPATTSGGGKLGAFSLNAFDLASPQTLFEREVDIWPTSRLVGYFK